jgi:hypothetical protein
MLDNTQLCDFYVRIRKKIDELGSNLSVLRRRRPR